MLLFAGTFDAGESARHVLAAGRKAWVQVVRGAIDVNGTRLAEGDGLAVISEAALDFGAGSGAEILVFDLP